MKYISISVILSFSISLGIASLEKPSQKSVYSHDQSQIEKNGSQTFGCALSKMNSWHYQYKNKEANCEENIDVSYSQNNQEWFSRKPKVSFGEHSLSFTNLYKLQKKNKNKTLVL